MGRPFSAMVKLGDDFKQQFDFGENGADSIVTIDRERHEEIGLCPLCREGKVFALENSYICERTLEKPPRCTFRISRVILQREIPKEQVQKLMDAGKTDLLPKFISKKGRAFSAYLKLENGKVGFEFEPRKSRATKPRLKKATAAT